MLIVIALLLAAILAAIIFHNNMVGDYMHRQLQVAEAQRKYLAALFGHDQDGDFSILIRCALDFYRKALNGRIPNLRVDDWCPSMSDRERVRKAAMRQEQDDHFLG